MKKQDEAQSIQHPNPLDRNRAILLSRDLLSVKDWVIIAAKCSKVEGRRVYPGDAAELTSISVLGPDERVLMDVMVRPSGAVNNELLRLHGSDQAHVFNAPSFKEVHRILSAGFAKTRVVSYQPAKIKEILFNLCKQEKLPSLQASFIDLQYEYSRFLGEMNPDKSYVFQKLPSAYDCSQPAISPLLECRQLYILLQSIAASSQILDTANKFDKNWSAAFYKPKLGPAEKIKGLLGLGD